jgi:uncharacterized protein YbjQ (UPF0145 family)
VSEIFTFVSFLITFASFLVFITLGFFFGRSAERRHFANLKTREMARRYVVTTQTKCFLAPAHGGKPPKLLMAETVVASDYLKSFLAKLRNIFGGEVRSFKTLLERARREVTVQLKEQAAAQGYNAICNVRLNTASLGGMSSWGASMASIIGWATAYETTLEPLPDERDRPNYNQLA